MVYTLLQFFAVLILGLQAADTNTTLRFGVELINELDISKYEINGNILFTVGYSKKDLSIYSYEDRGLYWFRTDAHGSVEQVSKVSYGYGGIGNPTDIKFDNGNSIWIADPDLNNITIFDSELNITDVITIPGRIVNKISVSPKFYSIIYMKYSDVDGYMEIFNTTGNRSYKFGRYPVDLTSSVLLMDCAMVSDENSVYVGNYNSGILSRYDYQGRLMYSVPTVHPINTVELDTQKIELDIFPDDSSFEGVLELTFKKVNTGSDRAILDMDVNSNFLIVLFAGNNIGRSSFIDVYDKRNGLYLASIDLKDLPNDDVLSLELVKESIFLQTRDSEGNNSIKQYRLTVN